MKFTKMQGIGNDYVYVNCFQEKIAAPSDLAVRISDRHLGVGSDGLILICPSEIADFQMVMYNSDGSRAQMCGNGVRCVGKYVHDKGLTSKTTVTVETLAGVKTLTLHLREDGTVGSVTVDMGAPILCPSDIPALGAGDSFVNQPLMVDGTEWLVTAVSMGNPHAIVYVDNTKHLDLPAIGPGFEHHPAFPERINTEFLQVIDRHTIRMRVWERGAGETLACGTGACASLVASVLTGKTDREATLRLLGGDLFIRWDPDTGHVFMTGPAEFVFEGEYPISTKE